MATNRNHEESSEYRMMEWAYEQEIPSQDEIDAILNDPRNMPR